MIAKEVKGVRLREIFRQRKEEDKAAVREMADGSVARALKHYAEAGQLHIHGEREEAKAELLNKWSKTGVCCPEDNLMLAAKNKEVRSRNQEAQQELKERGFLTGDSITHEGQEFYRGDRVIFGKNNKSPGVKNGTLGTVRRIDESRGIISVEVDGEGRGGHRTRTFSLSEYSELSLGYCITTHRAQGMSVEKAYVLTDETMTDREMSYVQVSRAKEATEIFTTKEEAGEHLEELVKSMERERKKQMALEIAKKQEMERQARLQSENTLGI